MPKRYSSAEKDQIIKAYLNSNINKNLFCKSNSVSNASLYRWLNKKDRKKEKSAFIPINLSHIEKSKTSFSQLNIKFPNGIIVEIPENLDCITINKYFKFIKEL